MDIGPINAIRAIPPVVPSHERADLAGVFEVEFRQQHQNESDSPARRASRGLEDEESEDEILKPEGGDDSAPHAGINLFA